MNIISVFRFSGLCFSKGGEKLSHRRYSFVKNLSRSRKDTYIFLKYSVQQSILLFWSIAHPNYLSQVFFIKALSFFYIRHHPPRLNSHLFTINLISTHLRINRDWGTLFSRLSNSILLINFLQLYYVKFVQIIARFLLIRRAYRER